MGNKVVEQLVTRNLNMKKDYNECEKFGNYGGYLSSVLRGRKELNLDQRLKGIRRKFNLKE